MAGGLSCTARLCDAATLYVKLANALALLSASMINAQNTVQGKVGTHMHSPMLDSISLSAKHVGM